MKKILVGQFERVLGTVAVTGGGDWVLDPHDDTTEAELIETVERVYARVQRRRKPFTRAQFIEKFFARGGAPATAYASSAWGKSFVPPSVEALINRLLPEDDPYLVEQRRRDQEHIMQIRTMQRA